MYIKIETTQKHFKGVNKSENVTSLSNLRRISCALAYLIYAQVLHETATLNVVPGYIKLVQNYDTDVTRSEYE